MRLTFVCGRRSVRALRGYRDAVAGSVRVLSVLPADLPSAIERIQVELTETDGADRILLVGAPEEKT